MLAPLSSLGQGPKIGEAAPQFTIHEIDGKLRTLKLLENEGPFFLYFGMAGDPVDDAVRPYINRIANTYVPSRAKWYAVMDMKPSQARSWSSETRLPYHVLLDTGGTLRRLFRVENAPTIVEIGVSGKVLHVWTGFSGEGMKRINREAATINRMKLHDFEFSRTPSVTQYSRGFGT